MEKGIFSLSVMRLISLGRINVLTYCLLLTVGILVHQSVSAQTPQWVRDGLNDIAGQSHAIATDAAGNAYVANSYSAFGILMVSKLDPAGNLIWVDTLGQVTGLGGEVSNGTKQVNVRGVEVVNVGGTERLFVGFDSQTVSAGYQTPGIYQFNITTGAVISGISYVESGSANAVNHFTVSHDGSELILVASELVLRIDPTDLTTINSQWEDGIDPMLTLVATDVSGFQAGGSSPDFFGTDPNPTAANMPFFTGSPLANTQAPTDATNYTFPAATTFIFGDTNTPGLGVTNVMNTTTPWTLPNTSFIVFRAVAETSEGMFVYFTLDINGTAYQGIAKMAKNDIYSVDWGKIWPQNNGNAGGILADENSNVYLYSWDNQYAFNGASTFDVLSSKFDKDGNIIWSKIYGTNSANANEVIWQASAAAIDRPNQEIVVSFYTDSYNSGIPSSLLLSTNYDGDIQNYTFLSEAGNSRVPTGTALDGSGNAYVAYFDNNGNTTTGVFKVNTTTLFLNPTFVSATKDSDTQITVTLSVNSATNGGNPADFTVIDGIGTNFAVGTQADGTSGDDEIVLTVANLATAIGDLNVTYTNNNDEITSISSGLSMLTDNTGVTIDTDNSAPTLSSGTLDSETQLTLTFNERVQTNGTNPDDFTVEDAMSNPFEVSAQADGTAQDTQVVLTIADVGSATGPLTVTYTNANDEISDFGGNALATDATGIDVSVVPIINPALVSATKDSDTQITVTLDINVETDGGNPTDFTVTDGIGTNFAVSAQADGTAGDANIVLTVANLATAIGDLKVTYTNNNNEITNLLSDRPMLTDMTGVTIDTDTSAPTLSSVSLNSGTQLTLTFSEPVQTNETNPTDFTIEDATNVSFVVSAQADGTAQDTEIVLTVADFSGATGPLTVTYTNSNNEIRDFGGNSVATDATGISVPLVPQLTTADATSVTQLSAILGGNITSQGVSAVNERGIVYAVTATNDDPELGGTGVMEDTNGTGAGEFSETISGLTANTAYSFKAYATNSSQTVYGPVKTFTTPELLAPTITFSDTTKTYGDVDYLLQATSNSNGATSYSIVATTTGTILSGTNNATVTLGNVGTVTIRVTQVADGIYTEGIKDMTLTITAKALTVTGLTGNDKEFDGTTAATVSGDATLSGVVTGDDVSLSGTPVFTFASADAGTDIAIATSGYTLSGDAAGNYTLTQPTLSADITTITAVDEVADEPIVYPNPASGKLQINVAIKQVKLIDMMGRTVEKEIVDGAIDVSDLETGLYLIRISQQQTVSFIKR